jgi:hypothetical protein
VSVGTPDGTEEVAGGVLRGREEALRTARNRAN